MAKKVTSELDESRLKKKVADKLSVQKDLKQDVALRFLKKRLRRAQRQRRALALRKKNSMSKKVATSPKK